MALIKNPLRSLPSRIVFFVFAATVLTALTVTAVSVSSIDSFLRSDIEESFPTLLDGAATELEAWYGQRLREITVFSESDVLESNLPVLTGSKSSRRRARAETEIEQYIGYVLDSFPQYAALFVLDEDNAPRLWVGQEIEIGEETLPRLAAVGEASVDDVIHLPTGDYQLLSAPLKDVKGRRLGSLHAVLELSSLIPIISAGDPGDTARILIVDSDGHPLAATREVSEPSVRVDPSILAAPGGVLQQYTTEDGNHMVGSTLHYSSFGWTLVVEQPYADAFEPMVSAIGNILVINLAIVLIVGLLAFRIAVSIVRPIEALSDAAGRISAGERDVVIPKSKSSDEVGVLTRAFNGMLERLHANSAELESSHTALATANGRLQTKNEELLSVNEVLEQLSITDGLTKLNNHRFFQEALLLESKRSDRVGQPLSLVLIDIDYFKLWNDRLGHAGGDEILRRMAEVMSELLRDSDVIARYGGEEFAVLTPNTDLDGAYQLAEKLRGAVAATHFVEDKLHDGSQVTISIGVSQYTSDRRIFFNDADRALYSAKESGRDCVMRADELSHA
jgi:diguanylate cyclase (GGDEF)-like protein